MNKINQNINTALLQHLKAKYFSDSNKLITLKKGDYLVRQNDVNLKLFLIIKGSLAGHLLSDTGTRYEVFQSTKDMFVGVHSFFSENHLAYASVVALNNCQIAFIDYKDLKEKKDINQNDDFLPLIVNEISIRQRFSNDVLLEKEVALKKLYHNEKMSTLGQMAAGLAHELNNAIGVISGNSEWIAKAIEQYIKSSTNDDTVLDFEHGFTKGHAITSQEIRDHKKRIEQKFKLSPINAKRLAKLGYSNEQIKNIKGENNLNELIENKLHIWELGVALRDMIISSKHATHVLKSVKQLSASDQIRSEIDINNTIQEALIILKNIVLPIDVELHLKNVPLIMANNGELIQIWVNIIKNGCESMLNSKTLHPKLEIITLFENETISIEISNNGPEISKEIRDKIFQPNFTTKKDGLSFGLGLGLSIVQRLLENYNGKINVVSQKGNTKFTIQLPTL